MESKDDVRKRLGRSTDHGDAVIQAFFGQPQQAVILIYEEDEQISPF